MCDGRFRSLFLDCLKYFKYLALALAVFVWNCFSHVIFTVSWLYVYFSHIIQCLCMAPHQILSCHLIISTFANQLNNLWYFWGFIRSKNNPLEILNFKWYLASFCFYHSSSVSASPTLHSTKLILLSGIVERISVFTVANSPQGSFWFVSSVHMWAPPSYSLSPIIIFIPTTPNSSFSFLFLNTAWRFSGRDLQLEICPAPQAQSWQGLTAVPLLTSKSLLSITVYITTVLPVKTYKSLGAILENCHE